MSTAVADREPLIDYPRAQRRPLSTVRPTAANRERVARRRARWSPYLYCSPHPEAPMITRLAPLLVDMVIEDAGARLPAVPGSLYPVGFRTQVLGHTGAPADAVRHDLPVGGADERLEHVRSMLVGGTTRLATQVSLAALLNVLSLYRVTVRSFARRVAEHGEPPLIYEVARAAYWLQPDTDHAIRPFRVLAESSDVAPAIRRSSLCRLIAHYCRRDLDLAACRPWAEAARRLVDGEHGTEFAARMGTSRLCRALALYAWRRRAADEMTETLRTAHAIANELVTGARDIAEHVTAVENERLVLEATLKAFVGSRGRMAVLDPRFAVDRIRELDPYDPYSLLIAGDALWLLGDDEGAVECFRSAGAMGTLPGALAAHRAGTVLSALNRRAESARWFAVVAELDAEYDAGIADR